MVLTQEEAGRRIALILASTATVVVGVTLLLFYGLGGASQRSETFGFTVWFVVFQEVVLFGTLVAMGLRSARGSSTVPLLAATFNTVLSYNAVALATVAIFNLLLLPQYATSLAYYTTCIAETGLGLASAILLRAVDVIQRTSHSRAPAARISLEDLLAACDRIRAASEAQGWQLDRSVEELAERIRFSEGLRQNPRLLQQVCDTLGELEGLPDTGRSETAERMVKAASVLATRRT